MEDRNKISVVVPVLNESRDLARLLNSIISARIPPDQIWVIDGGSIDATERTSRDLGVNFVILSTTPRSSDARGPAGCMAARNRGIELVRTEWILFLDADMEITSELVRELSSILEGGSVAVAIPEVTTGESLLARVRRWDRARPSLGHLNESPRAFRVDFMRSLHGYRTDMAGFDDIELQARLVEKGVRIDRTSVPLYHHEEEVTVGEYLRKRKRYASGYARLVKLHPDYARRLTSPSRLLISAGLNFRADPKPLLLAGALALKGVERVFASTGR